MSAPQATGGQSTPLIPRDVLFGNPERAGSQLSHDGKWLSFLAPLNGVLNVWVAPADDVSKARAITSDTKRGIRQYFWAYDNVHILYLQDAGGDENWKVYSVEVASGKARDLTPFDSIPGPDGNPIRVPTGRGPDGQTQYMTLRPAAQVQGVSDLFPGAVLVGLNNRNPSYHDLYKVDIATGQLTLVMENDEYAAIMADDSFTPRLAMRQTADGGLEFLKADGKGSFTPWQTVAQADALTTSPQGFTKDGSSVYMVDSRDGNTSRLTLVNLKTDEVKTLAADPKADADGVLTHPKTNEAQAVSFEFDRVRWQVLDPSIEPDLAYLKTVADGEVSISSRTLDDSRWLVNYLMDDGPVRLYRYDRDPKSGKPGKATFLYTNRPRLEGQPLAKMHPVVIKSRDGMNLVSYLTIPAGTDTKKAGQPDKPLPMVLMVHGGPWARDSWGFNPYHQWLANRGYAVLSVNFRGSTGFGKEFVNAGDREWAAAMHNDLLDAVDWAVSKGVADKNKVAIMGGSYGGYATLAGLTFTPDVFACGVSIVGPSNLVTLLNSIPMHWAPMIEMMTSRVGDHRTEEGRAFLASRSPLTHVDKITRPLLIGQGANDPRVKQNESDQIVSAMERKGIPVTYVVFPDEGHGFARPENNMAFNAIVEGFLAQHLGGRAQPIGEDVRASTARVPTGAAGVPGLSAATHTPGK
ncbi:MAG: S9 family peptidase [Planctomycetota bacterium]|nr:S9 family peptidase [Planctomycetota bacterium]